MKRFFQKRIDLIKVDRPVRSGFRISAVIFAVLVFCFMALPSCVYQLGDQIAEYTAAQELFVGNLPIGNLTLGNDPAWPAFIGYLGSALAGIGCFLLLNRKILLIDLIGAILSFILVATQPLFTIMRFTETYSNGTFTFGLGYILPLIFSFGIVVCLAVVYVLPSKDGEKA